MYAIWRAAAATKNLFSLNAQAAHAIGLLIWIYSKKGCASRIRLIRRQHTAAAVPPSCFFWRDVSRAVGAFFIFKRGPWVERFRFAGALLHFDIPKGGTCFSLCDASPFASRLCWMWKGERELSPWQPALHRRPNQISSLSALRTLALRPVRTNAWKIRL